MKALVTGAAGFIGASLSGELLGRGYDVTGVDNLNDYYDVSLKEARLELLQCKPNFRFQKLDIANRPEMKELFSVWSFDTVVHLAAQAGVRYSIENPQAYVESNLVGFGNVLEECRQNRIPHLIYASSSSVYGANTTLPFVETDNVDHPISLYAATKRANELMAHAYSHLYGLATTGLRFFTVYGPWGRPDMALFKFTRNILSGEPIPVYNHGQMVRDFTYIDDVVEGVMHVIGKPPRVTTGPEGTSTLAPWRIYNIGNNQRVQLMDYISTLERELGKKAQLSFFPMQDGDVPATEADIGKLESDFGYRPHVKVEEGIARFVSWYQAYYGTKK